jgi:hypothetical protein
LLIGLSEWMTRISRGPGCVPVQAGFIENLNMPGTAGVKPVEDSGGHFEKSVPVFIG